MEPYLSDLLRLLEGLREPAMQCVVLRHMQTLSAYYVSLPQLQRALVRSLVAQWATGEHHVRVVAFLILRRVTLLLPHPSLHHTLKVRSKGLFCCTYAPTQPSMQFLSPLTEALPSICP